MQHFLGHGAQSAPLIWKLAVTFNLISPDTWSSRWRESAGRFFSSMLQAFTLLQQQLVFQRSSNRAWPHLADWLCLYRWWVWWNSTPIEIWTKIKRWWICCAVTRFLFLQAENSQTKTRVSSFFFFPSLFLSFILIESCLHSAEVKCFIRTVHYANISFELVQREDHAEKDFGFWMRFSSFVSFWHFVFCPSFSFSLYPWCLVWSIAMKKNFIYCYEKHFNLCGLLPPFREPERN